MHDLLRIEDLCVDFITSNRTTKALKGVSFSIRRGELLALVGESGSGKSVTSLSVLQLLPQPPAVYSGGRILFSEDGAQHLNLLQEPSSVIRQIRGHKIAMIFQEPMSSLNPVITCGKQVMEALLIHKDLSKSEAKEQTIAWFEKVKLPEPSKIFDRYPHQLSGGQKQRVMIAMAMCCQPSLLICDEPTTALDVTVQKSILQLIKDLQQQENMGVLFITHDLGVVAQIADRVAIMYKGEIVEENDARTIFTDAKHPYTQALIACRPARHKKGEKLPTVNDFLNPANHVVNAQILSAEHVFKHSEKVILQAKDLVVRFTTKTNLLGKPKNFFTAVDHVNLDIYKGETLGLVGESGCGKTTLGRTLLKLIPPSSGFIIYNGEDITHLEKEQTRKLRKEVQLIFQDPFSSLNPRLTIGDAIAEPMKVTGSLHSSRERKKKVKELLERVSLSDGMMGRYPHEFSGGQRQRIVIARALAMDPAFLVCDESVSALDVSVQAQVLNLLNELKKDLGLTMLFISHDLSVVRYMCDRIMVMNKGKIIESGLSEEVYKHPQTAYTRQLIEAIPNL
jgi:peptide/nickel transport system ATP-binding protein